MRRGSLRRGGHGTGLIEKRRPETGLIEEKRPEMGIIEERRPFKTLKALKTFIATVCQYNTIQCYLSTECIQNQFLFLKDCTSKHVGQIVAIRASRAL